MQKYSAHKRKRRKISAYKKNAAHAKRKMQLQQMRLGNARSKSRFDVGSSAGVGGGVASRCWLGGVAAGRPLGRSAARSLLCSSSCLVTTKTKRSRQQQRARATRIKPQQMTTTHQHRRSWLAGYARSCQALLAAWMRRAAWW